MLLDLAVVVIGLAELVEQIHLSMQLKELAAAVEQLLDTYHQEALAELAAVEKVIMVMEPMALQVEPIKVLAVAEATETMVILEDQVSL